MAEWLNLRIVVTHCCISAAICLDEYFCWMFLLCLPRLCNTETEMSSFWWNFHHWLHWKLSKWQLPVQPVIKISSKWRHFRFSEQQCNTRADLTHWVRDKMTAYFLTTILDAFSWMKTYKFLLSFHWSLFTGVQQVHYSNIGSDNGLVPARRKSLCKPMMVSLLTHIY